MLKNTDEKLLRILLAAEKPLISRDIAFQTMMSTKTVQRRLKDLHQLLNAHGASILTRKGIGSSLQIHDANRFQSFCDEFLQEETQDPLQGQLLYQIVSLLLAKDYVKADDLASEVYISKSKLTCLLQELRTILANYDLCLAAKPYRGLRIEGSEFDLRRFLSSYFAQQTLYENIIHQHHNQDNEDYHIIHQIIETALCEQQYAMPAHIVKNIELHLYVMLSRLRKGMCYTACDALSTNGRYEAEQRLAEMILRTLEEAVGVKIPHSEAEYFLLHLIGKKVLDVSERNSIPEETNTLVDKILQRIYEAKNIDLRKDLHLRVMLGLHIVPLQTRLRYHMILKNPILDDVRSRCVMGYDLAILCGEVIKEAYDCMLAEDEISYFALHFDVALNSAQKAIRKHRILVICASGRASAQLLKIKFLQLFEDYIEHMEVCDVHEVASKLASESYDYIFTTIPWKGDTAIPVFEFQFFLNHTTIDDIRSILKGDQQENKIDQFFDSSLFFGVQDLSTREDVLAYMMKRLASIMKLPKQFATLVQEREAVCGTDFLPYVAMPHPNRVVSEETFIAVLILRKPIRWHRHKVQMVFLISISRKDSETYKFLLEWLVEALSDSKAIKYMVEEGTYEALQKGLLCKRE